MSLTSGFTPESIEDWADFLRGLKLLHIVTLNFIFTIFPKVYLNKYFMIIKIAHLPLLFHIYLACFSRYFKELIISKVFHCVFLLNETF